MHFCTEYHAYLCQIPGTFLISCLLQTALLHKQLHAGKLSIENSMTLHSAKTGLGGLPGREAGIMS